MEIMKLAKAMGTFGGPIRFTEKRRDLYVPRVKKVEGGPGAYLFGGNLGKLKDLNNPQKFSKGLK